MDRGSASSLLSVSRRPMSAGAWTGMSSTAVRPGVRHASAAAHRGPYMMDSSTRTTDELSATKVSLHVYDINPIQSNPMSITEAGQGLYFRLFLKI